MTAAAITIIWLYGMVFAAVRWLKIKECHAPLSVVSVTGILLFFAGICHFLKPVAVSILILGSLFFITAGACAVCCRSTGSPFVQKNVSTLLVGMLLFSWALTLGMGFTVDDDYVYWGIIGKYLNHYHHLPDGDTTIMRRHLAYTPGVSLVHYMVYQAGGRYSESLSYFAQNLFLISALLVVFSRTTLSRGWLLFCLAALLLTVFSGSVFTKLQVDHLLAVYLFAGLWIIFKEERSIWTLIMIALPACFLFLIKQVGFIMGLVLLLVFILQTLLDEKIQRPARLKLLAGTFCVGALMFVIRQAWAGHCQAMGFVQFSGAINKESLAAAVNIFSNEATRNGFFIFIKDILIGPADRLNLPYLVWYVFLAAAVKTLHSQFDRAGKKSLVLTVTLLAAVFGVYLTTLYFMQVIVFEVGSAWEHTIGLSRYMNIFFSAYILFFTLMAVERMRWFQDASAKKVAIVSTVLVLILGLSRVETSMNREPHYQQAAKIAGQMEAVMDMTQPHRIGVVPGTQDNMLWIRLLYYLLPHNVNRGRFPADNKNIFLKAVAEYDYLLFHHPGPDISGWAAGLMDKPFKGKGFYRVHVKAATLKNPEPKIVLRKISQIE